MHVNVGPDTHGGAVGVARFCQGQTGGYHELVDDIEYVVGAHDNQVVAGAAGANEDGFHICMIGAADQTDAQWHDGFSVATWQRAAERARAACVRFGIPFRLLSTAEVAAGASGICGHVNVSQAYHKSTHTDPGPHFPWAEFMAHVVGATPAPLPQVKEDMYLIRDERGAITLVGPKLFTHLSPTQLAAVKLLKPALQQVQVTSAQADLIKQAVGA
jgi:hypothetical protein